ncbi:MAG TPA: DoxX family protein, partial [Gemmataceae bacterium]|nr:DoxX family protein [Gemmataceae bacterium]
MAFFNAVLRETPRPAWARIVLWIVSVTLGLVFAARGSSKLLHSAPPEHFANVAFPPWFLVLLGILEIGGGLLLVVPRTGTYGAGVLASIIAGVICTHAIVGWNLPLMPLLVLLAPLIVVGYARRPWEAARARFLAALDRYAEREI